MSTGHMSKDIDFYSHEYEEHVKRLFESTAHESKRENMSGESRRLEGRRKILSVRTEDYVSKER